MGKMKYLARKLNVEMFNVKSSELIYFILHIYISFINQEDNLNIIDL